MLGAFPAHRLRVQGAQNPHDNGVAKQNCALLAQGRARFDMDGGFPWTEGKGGPGSVPVMLVTVHTYEPDQFF